MNAKRAKAMRRIAERITAGRNLPERAIRSMQVGPDAHQVRVFNAADTTRGQYRALKSVVAAAYGSQP